MAAASGSPIICMCCAARRSAPIADTDQQAAREGGNDTRVHGYILYPADDRRLVGRMAT